MSISNAERRQIANEMIFRRHNEKVSDALDALDAMHREDGNDQLAEGKDLVLRFKCECSDENCTLRIPMSVSEYQEIHTDRETFILLPGHQVESIEETIKKTHLYHIVRKNHPIPELSGALNKTATNNV